MVNYQYICVFALEMKNFARITLLCLWIFAIAAPSIITLLDVENPVVITNLNEEEQQEFGKKSQAEEKIVKDSTFNFYFKSLHKNSIVDTYNLLSYNNSFLEILSPPPEQLS